MSSVGKQNVKCALCGKSSEQMALRSLNFEGSRDLDSRPPEPARAQIYSSIQECPHCHYCAHFIGVAKKNITLDTLKSLDYISLLNDSSVPTNAKRAWLSAILEATANYAKEAAFDYLLAAWILEDEKRIDLCHKVRNNAIAEFTSYLEAFNNDIDIALVFVDLMRRSKRFGDTIELCDGLLSMKPNIQTCKIIKFQKSLAIAANDKSYKVSEVI